MEICRNIVDGTRHANDTSSASFDPERLHLVERNRSKIDALKPHQRIKRHLRRIVDDIVDDFCPQFRTHRPNFRIDPEFPRFENRLFDLQIDVDLRNVDAKIRHVVRLGDDVTTSL